MNEWINEWTIKNPQLKAIKHRQSLEYYFGSFYSPESLQITTKNRELEEAGRPENRAKSEERIGGNATSRVAKP